MSFVSGFDGPGHRPTERPPAGLWAVLTGLFGGPFPADPRVDPPLPSAAGPPATHQLGDGTVHLEVVFAVVIDLEVAIDANSDYWVSFFLDGYLPATQLDERGVTSVALEVLKVSDLPVTLDVARHLEMWSRHGTCLTGAVRFERRTIDEARGRGPIRNLSLNDIAGDEVSLSIADRADGA